MSMVAYPLITIHKVSGTFFMQGKGCFSLLLVVCLVPSLKGRARRHVCAGNEQALDSCILSGGDTL